METKTYNTRPMEQRFWEKVDKSGECWRWLGTMTNAGYGSFRLKTKTVRAHRQAYELSVGSIPKGKHLDHICRNRNCVRPSHLRVVTAKENVENQSAKSIKSISGYRGVHWRKDCHKWAVIVRHNGKAHFFGLYADKEIAAVTAREARNSLFTHNDADR